MFHGFDYSSFFTDSPTKRLTVLAQAVNHILEGRDKKRDPFIDATTALGRAYALATPHEDALAIREEVGFFQAVKAAVTKTITTPAPRRGKSLEEIDIEVQAIVDRAVAPGEIIDLFGLAGLEWPDISILSDDFLVEVKALPQKNVAVELLRRLIEDEIQRRRT